MKRDMDLIRKILLKIEEYPEPTGYIKINLEGYSNDEIAYHIKLLFQAGLIEAANLSDSAGFDWKAKSLTWEGHEFLDSARNDTVWNKAKIKIKEKGLELTIETLKFTLKEIILSMIK